MNYKRFKKVQCECNDDMRSHILDLNTYMNIMIIHYSVPFQDETAVIEKYDKPLNRHVFKNAKQIRQINPITKQAVIFNSLSDIYRRLGMTGRAIQKAISEKVMSEQAKLYS